MEATLPEDAMHEPTVGSDAPPTEPRPARAPTAAWQGQRQRFDPRDKSPGWAALLSVVPGLGQVYIGYYGRGFLIGSVTVFLFWMTEMVGGDAEGLFVFAGLFAWAFGIIDAGRMAALYNHMIAGSGEIEVPDDIRMPALGGSIAGGAALLAIGLVALSNTAFGYSLAWIETWWPVAPAAVGAWLFLRGLKERQG